jgi:uncharacterized protein (TIGR00369 family)
MAEFTPRQQDFENAVRAYHARTPLHALLGMHLEQIEAGRVTVSMPRRTELTQQNGFLHAGVLIALADASAGMAAWTLLPEKHNLLSIQISTSLQRAADCERAVAEGVVTKPGKRLMVAEGTVYAAGDGSRTALIKATVTLAVLPEQE